MLPPIEILWLFIALSRDDNLDLLNLSIAIRNGDHDAFKRFYDNHYPGLYRFMITRGMNHDEAEDLVQKAFIMIWEKRRNIDETKSLRAYIVNHRLLISGSLLNRLKNVSFRISGRSCLPLT